MILGGSLRENPPSGKVQSKGYLSNQVFLLNLLEPDFTRMQNMSRGFVSLYPAFFDGENNSLLLINEDSINSEPECLRYHLDQVGIA